MRARLIRIRAQSGIRPRDRLASANRACDRDATSIGSTERRPRIRARACRSLPSEAARHGSAAYNLAVATIVPWRCDPRSLDPRVKPRASSFCEAPRVDGRGIAMTRPSRIPGRARGHQGVERALITQRRISDRSVVDGALGSSPALADLARDGGGDGSGAFSRVGGGFGFARLASAQRDHAIALGHGLRRIAQQAGESDLDARSASAE